MIENNIPMIHEIFKKVKSINPRLYLELKRELKESNNINPIFKCVNGYISLDLYDYLIDTGSFFISVDLDNANPFLASFIYLAGFVRYCDYDDYSFSYISIHSLLDVSIPSNPPLYKLKDFKFNIFTFIKDNMGEEYMIEFNNYLIKKCY